MTLIFWLCEEVRRKKVVPTGINGAVECTGRTGDHSSTSGSEPASGLTGSIKPWPILLKPFTGNTVLRIGIGLIFVKISG